MGVGTVFITEKYGNLEVSVLIQRECILRETFPHKIEAQDLRGNDVVIWVQKDLTYDVQMANDESSKNYEISSADLGGYLHVTRVNRHLLSRIRIGLKANGRPLYRYIVGGGWTVTVRHNNKYVVLFHDRDNKYFVDFMRDLVQKGYLGQDVTSQLIEPYNAQDREQGLMPHRLPSSGNVAYQGHFELLKGV